MTLRFGTDGVRGVANTELTPEFTVALARAAARVLGGSRVLIGRDTRRSGDRTCGPFGTCCGEGSFDSRVAHQARCGQSDDV